MTKRRNLRRRNLRNSSRSLHHETLEKRELLAAEAGGLELGPRLISVAANSGEQFDLDGSNELEVAPRELTFRFDGAQALDENTLAAIQIRSSGGDGTFDDGNEQTIIPGFLGFADDNNPRIVVARFAETLADDQYVIEVSGFDDTDPNNPIVGLRNVSGDLFCPPDSDDANRPMQQIFMNVEVGPQVTAIVPQPIVGVGAARTQLRDTIHVYFNNDPLSNPNAPAINNSNSSLPVVQPQFYKLLYTHDTVENTDDVASGGPFLPTEVSYDPALNRATLRFGSDLSLIAPANANNGAGTFRLRVGSGEAIPSPPVAFDASTDAGDIFSNASALGVPFGGAGTQSVVVTGGVIQAAEDVIPQWPGAGDASGLRDYRRDAPVVGRTDTQTGINRYEYNFANLYGLDPQENNLENAITPAQQQRAREILGLYSERLGVEFIETENSGLQIVTGDLRALAVSADTGIDTPFSIYRVSDADPTQGVLVLDAGENWYDGYGLSPDTRPSWFVEAVRGIGALLGIGNTFELPEGDGSGGSSPSEPNSLGFTPLDPNLPVEPDFLTEGNIIVGQALHRPETSDVDFYSFRASSNGRISLETFAQRSEDSSLLDTRLELYQVVDPVAGEYRLVASNDDFFSDDSFISVDLELPLDITGSVIPTDYIVGVSASGNDDYNGEVDGSGIGGVTEGAYDLRVTFESQVGSTITDTTGTELDGDADGRAGGDFNFWFRVARDTANPATDEPRVIFVDKFDGNDNLNDGTLLSPLQTISSAFAIARPNDIVRLLPNGGDDDLIDTTDDNLAYEIGFGGSGTRQLSDGGEFEVPQGVTVMIDAGAILKLRTAKISVGSESVDEDRSLAALQILGTPQPIDASGNFLEDGLGAVYFTSYDDATLGVDTNTLNVDPQAGNWAGIEFRNDFDLAEGRAVWENEGIFLDYSSHANIRFGGGSISPNQPAVNALFMAEARPTLIYNTITDNADAAISADPNSFRETNFHSAQFQRVAAFTSDYNRVGPEITGNTLLRNTTNGLFVRVVTPAAGQLEPMQVAGRFDDHDIVHVLSQVLVLEGQPGGHLLLEEAPDVLNVTFGNASGGSLTPSTFYDYRITYVTAEGRESLASLPTAMKSAPLGGSIVLNNLPVAPSEFAGRRIYRLNPVSNEYEFVTQLDRGTTSYTDDGTTRGGLLPAAATAATRLLPRFDARLSIDPGLIIKLENSRIEAGFGSDFYAEGADGDPIVFTSRLDDRFGAGGTFDSNNDTAQPSPGDWGGLIFRQDSTGSLEYVEVQFGGGTTPVEGVFTEFNAIEILQADVRIAHSVITDNADGFNTTSVRGGRGFNGPGAIFVRGSQPIIVDNTITNNEGAAISINPDAMNFHDLVDYGRATGNADVVVTDSDNQGPLISGNRLVRNDINGLLVRSEVLQTESVWDDTDIVHVVNGNIQVDSHHHRGGLRLKSDPNQSLVVKFANGATLVGSGRPLDIEDRIGGTLQVIGQGGFPVIMTSLADDSVGAGFTPEGIAQTDTDNLAGTPQPGDWNGIELRSYVNDRNVAYVIESARAIPAANGENAIADDAQVIGDLAAHEYAGDESERLGFNIRGALADADDQDVYRFTADGGTVVYIDIDDTSFGLDTVVELIDVNDQVLARSDNSFEEATNPGLLVNNLSPGSVLPLFQVGDGAVEGPNALDAGMRVILDGTGRDNTYYVRVRNANGQSSGQYQLSIRLREADEVAGSTVQLADIRYSTSAITVSGAPLHSPLAGDASENLNANGLETNNNILTFNEANSAHIGNLLTSDRGSLRVSGTIGNVSPTILFPSDDVDVYQVDLFRQEIEPDVFDSENRFVSVTFDVDYADQLGRVNTSLSVFNSAGQLILHSRDSNVSDDVGRPLEGDDPTNLTGGSVGVLDAYIGPVELPEDTYYVAVSSAVAIPTVLDQLFTEQPTDTEVRLMPINSIRRIADDRLDTAGLDFHFGDQYTADRPIISPLFTDESIVPFGIDDLRLFVSYDSGISGNNNSSLASFNPFTGVMDRLIGQSAQPTGDIAARRDGELFAFSLGPPNGPENNGNVGNYLNISPANGAAVNVGDDGITFMRNNQAGNDLEADDAAQLDVLALTFPQTDGNSINTTVVGNNERFFTVGQRDNNGRAGEIPDIYAKNIFYTNVSSTGETTSRGSTNANFHRNFDGTIPYTPFYGSTSPDFEWGFVDTGAIRRSEPEDFRFGAAIADPNADGGEITGLAVDPDAPTTMYAVTDQGGFHIFDYTVTVDGTGDFLSRATNIIPTNFLGKLAPDPLDFASQARGFIQFEGLTLGPRAINNQAYRDIFYGVSAEGWLYAFQVDAGTLTPAHVFYNGLSAIPLTFEGGVSAGTASPHGLAFSILEENPWHFTADRRVDNGHGTEIPYDQSRVGVVGDTSLYFGFEITNNPADNTVSRDDADPLGEISPGGTQGSVISKSFSLEEYSPDDKPTLYFSYFLEVEDNDDYQPGPVQQRDSFRAYAAGDDGRWLLLATNNSFKSLANVDEFDSYDTTDIPVQTLFDDSNAWRQARVDLSPLAGNEEVRIRFDFSNAGAARQTFGALELVAVDGDQVEDRSLLVLQNEQFETVILDSVVGRDVVIPSGAELANGDGFVVVGPDGPIPVTFVSGAPTAPGEVTFSASQSALEIAEAVVDAVPASLRAISDGNGIISFLAATDVFVLGDSPIGQSNPVDVVQTADQLLVPNGLSMSSFEELVVDGAGTTTRFFFVTAADATGTDPDEFIFDPMESAFDIGLRIVNLLPDVLDAVLETDGRITFLNGPVNFTFTPSAPANSVNNRPVEQNRLEVIVPDGNGLVDGSQVTFSDANGTTSITFVLNTVPEGPGTVHFFPGDTANDIAMRLLAALPATLVPLLNITGDGVLVIADDAFGAPGVLDQPIGAESITFPSGAVPLENDSLNIFDQFFRNVPINFVEVPVATPAVPATIDIFGVITPGTVFYQTTDTPDVIAANFAIASANFFVNEVFGDTVLTYGALDSNTTDPDSQIINDATLGQFIQLPPSGGMIDGEGITILSPFGNVSVQFVQQAFGGPNQVFYNNNESSAVIQSRLQALLPPQLRAIVTQTGTSGPVVQILGATDIIVFDPMSLILTGPNAYARSVLNLNIQDGNEIRNGEQLEITLNGVTETITFVRTGSSASAPGTIEIFYDATDVAADLYDRIVQALPQNFQAYIALDDDGVNIGGPGATGVVNQGVPPFANTTVDINEFAVPVILPSGAELNDGEVVQILRKDDIFGAAPINITFRLGTGAPGPNEVVYTLSDTAADITQKFYDALPRSVQGFIFSPREVYLLNATSVTPQAGSSIISFNLSQGAIPVQVNSTMTSAEVATELRAALAEAFGRLATVDGSSAALPDDFPVLGGDRIRIYNAVVNDPGSYSVSSFDVNSFEPTDAFTTFTSSALPTEFYGLSRPTAFAGNQIDGAGGANNNIEGVYIDDIIVGFAERGEMVLNAPVNRNFTLNPEVLPDDRGPIDAQPERQNETLTGGYSLEVRTSDEYGVPEDYDPINLQLGEEFGSGRSFDTNDRLVDGAVTLVAQPGSSLIDGDTFVLSDGTRQLTFEFDSILEVGVTTGNVAVPFDPIGIEVEDVAASIRNAINSPQARGVLDITAATGDSREVGGTTSSMVELFGPSINVNPGGGRFLKMDLVAEETFQGRETSKLIPVIDHDNQVVTYVSHGDQQARAAVTGFVDGTVDVLVATGKIGDRVDTGEGVDDAPVILLNDPNSDVDYVRVYLEAGQTIDIDIDTVGFARGGQVLDIPVITVLEGNGGTALNGLGGTPAQTDLFTPSSAPGEVEAGAFLKFQAQSSAYYDVAISASPFASLGNGLFFGGGFGEYQLTIRPDADTSPAIPDRDVVMVDYHFGNSDFNRVQDQGQIIISSNFISDALAFGVFATTDVRGAAAAVDPSNNSIGPHNNPTPGSANLLRNINTDALIPGAVISNNLIVNSGLAGINFSGGTAANGEAPAPVPYGRIVNNTVVGSGTGNGIVVASNASPTLLNNLVSGLDQGFSIDQSSLNAGTIVGGNAFHNNVTNSNSPLASSSIIINGEVFQDPARRIYIPVAGSDVIDSSFSSLADRGEFFDTVKEPVGISASPIIAPVFDAYGQPRFDDPLINPPGPGGEITTIDRGAIDRADRTALIAVLTGPQDSIGSVVVGGDGDPDESFVRLDSGTVEFFEVQLLDDAGTGPDKDTITPESVLLTENGRRLIPDVDFVFSYNDNSRTIRLTPLAGLWLPDAVYEITLNNQQRIQYEVPRGSQITDGDQVIVADTSGNTTVFEYESGFSLQVPQTTLLTITGPNSAFQDRDTFSISAPNGNTLAFEINLAGATAGGNVPIELGSATTISEVRDAILTTLNGPLPFNPTLTISEFLDIQPLAIGNDQIQLGTISGHSTPLSISGLDVTGQAAGVSDTETFTYTNAAGLVTFEFDSDGSVTNGNIPVTFTRTDTPGEIANQIALSIQQNVIGLAGAIGSSDGTVVLGGTVGDQLMVDQSSLTASGAPGVTGSLTLTIPPAETGSSIDGSTFSVDVDGVAITFRYTTDPALTSPDRLILLSPTDLLDDIASKSAAVIALAFPDELSPSSSNDTIILGEQAAIPPAGEPGSFTSADGGTAGLILGGVSGGAIPVNFLPTSPQTSIAATLQGRIADSPLVVETFSPGGGTILISDAQSLSVVSNGVAQNNIGILTPAVSDLAGNAVRETRINNETRFTIIMPDVLFDLGDAPVSYDTLFADNGARHTVGGNELPRLGRFVDTEPDALVVNLDDAPFDVSLSQTPVAPALFDIDPISIPDTDIVRLNRMPGGGETLTIAVGPIATTFELVEITSNPVGGNIAINFSNMDTVEEVTTKILDTIRTTLPQTDDGLVIERTGVTEFRIIATDDEDGVSQGVFSDGLVNRTVFTLPGTNPGNIQPENVLGFLNPLDPAGTNIAINVAGSGLLHAWIDFDQNGQFDESEQVLKNVPVSGDVDTGTFNFVTVFTPDFAVEGDTWMRVRVSESGNLLPTGVAVGGEVEDYQVEIISIPLPIPEDDQYTITEDEQLDTLTAGLPSLDGVGTPNPDFIPPEAFLPAQFIAGELPTNGTLVSLDPVTGHFVYQPNDDFNGVDSFTYRLSTQQNASASLIASDAFATVTIRITPVNDAPGAVDQTLVALEDAPLIITADQLLTGATGDADAQATTIDPLDPNLPFLNEENQQLFVTSVQGSGGVIDASNTASAAGNLVVTQNGLGIDLQVTNVTDADLVTLSFAGTTATFELVPDGGTPTGGTTAVPMLTGDSAADVAARLANAIQGIFGATSPIVTVGQVGDTITTSFTPITVSSSGSSAFTVTPGAGSLVVDVTGVPVPTAAPTPTDPNPVVGDTLTINYGTSTVTYELLAEGAVAAAGNVGITVRPFVVPVAPPVGAPPEDVAAFTAAFNAYQAVLQSSVAEQLATAIQSELHSNSVGLVSRIADGSTAPNRIDVQAASITAAKAFETSRGSAIAIFDSFGDLIELRYISDLDLNRDNPPPALPTHLDEFTFTVRDSGLSIDLVNSVMDYAAPALSAAATVSLDVAPQNDTPVLNPDVISVGPLGPDSATVLTAWEIFGGATPLEDTTLQIDPAFLLSNDLRARMSAADENVANSLNDLGLTIQSVTMANPAQGSVSRLFDGTIVFTPAPDVFGDIIFTYSARDQGINESATGQRNVVPLISFDGTVTVSVQPVNDVPTAFDRDLTYTESADPGVGDPYVFTSDQLIFGASTETPNQPGTFPPTLAAPFNEAEQTLRVVSFSTLAGTVDASSLAGSGLQTLTLPSDAGGTFEFDFQDGVFTVGRFFSSADYNNRTPFAPTESFTYEIADDGLTTDPQDSNNTFNLPDARSDDDPSSVPATVTITVIDSNDAPTFSIDAPLVGALPTIDILEFADADDTLGRSNPTVIDDFVINVMPGPSTAVDETDRQSVVFSFPANLNPASNVPPGLMLQLPELTPDGQLTLFPAPDAIGTATFVVVAEDIEPGTTGFAPRQTLATFVVNVQPINDRPRFDPNLLGTSDAAGPDEAYSVDSGEDFNNDGLLDRATITYTLREDNTQALGVLEDYFIPLSAAASAGYSRIGLLDVFTVGPDNEAGAFPGGAQELEFLQAGNDPTLPGLDRTTDRGGILSPVFNSSNELIGLNYRPPLDFNASFAGVDSFTYQVRDDSTTGGESYNLAAGALIPEQRISTNRVELFMNPVNDRPEFATQTLSIDVQEDSQEIDFVDYAFNISAGPPLSAFDEVDVLTGQLVEFTVTSLDFPREESDNFFSIYPSIDNDTGLLNFQPAADVFGEYRFELVLNDRNQDGSISDNTTRGDLISSIPVTLTINVQPVNDPPIVDPTAAPLNFTILEDGTFDILVEGDNTSPGLLDPFFPGPSVGATDEAADIAPRVGGNQTVTLGAPIPANSAQGGTIEFVTEGGTPRLRYTPRANFVGMDSFIYTVTDDGITVSPDGSVNSDPKIASNIVTFEVQPVNDAPLFSGAANVQSDEDAGVVTVPDWASNILAGPATAIDELSGIGTAQNLEFVFTQVSSNPELFLTPPTAIIDPTTGAAVLTYESAPDANGNATFEVILRDNGPRDASIGDEFLSDPPRTFVINVRPVNDPPSFDLVSTSIERNEDSGPFNVVQAINVSPGPEDEQSQTVTFNIEMDPVFDSLFSEPPTINADGLLRFTPAPNQNTDNANGPAIIRVFARDSEDPPAVSSAVEFQIVINEVNDAPRAFSDSLNSDEDTIINISASDLLLNDVDPDLDTNAAENVQIVLAPISLSVSGAEVTFDPATGQITYDPTTSIALQSLAPGDSLVDSFAYSLIDASGATSNLVTVALNISGINDAPNLGLDAPQLNPEGSTIIRVLDNDNDVDGFIDPSSMQITLQPAFGTVVILPNGTLEFTPFASFPEEDVFSYTVADNLGERSEEATVTISANASPVASDDQRGTFLDEPVFVDVAANDFDPDGTIDLTSIVIVAQPARGQAIPQANGTVQYLPDPGFLGRDVFQYRIADAEGRLSNIADVQTQVVASRLQNPDRFSDVNDDGFVSAVDALLIINHLTRSDSISIPVVETDRGPNFFDVSGNQSISAADALRVINELSRLNAGEGVNGEQVVPLSSTGSAESESIVGTDIAPVDLVAPSKIVDVSSTAPVSTDVIDLIAAERESDSDEESSIAAVDAAMADLL